MGRPMRPRRTNRYSADFKLQAVKLSQIEGVRVQDVAEALDIHPYMLSRWRKEAREGQIKMEPQPPPNPVAKMSTHRTSWRLAYLG